jgi:16S rRNA pseudouridine516 synthase
MARLDRLLANLGYGSRQAVRHMIADGAVTLDGERLRDGGLKLAVSAELPQHLQVNGAPLDPPAPLTLVVHKPLGVVCSHNEPGRSLYELLPPRWRARDPLLSTVGRLDADTSGLIIVTDDGALLHKIIAPKSDVPKRYDVTLADALTGKEAAIFAAGGLMLDGETKPLAPATLEPRGPARAWLTIGEGRYHQVRRMFAALGNRVAALHRDRIGALDLPGDLAAGQYRPIEPAELEAIFGRDQVPIR